MEKHKLCGWIKNDKMNILTEEQIKNIPAGKETDVLIAEKVMGLVPCDNWYLQQITSIGPIFIRNQNSCKHDGKCYPKEYIPEYSTNISAAWGIVDKLWSRFNFAINRMDMYDGDYIASVMAFNSNEWKSAHANIAPLAICRAALLTLSEE
jgi:hypothetical protein